MGILWRHIVRSSSASLANGAASAAVLFLTARWLGPDGRGVYSAAIGWVIVFGTLGSLSWGQALVHAIGGRPDHTWLQPVFGTAMALTAVLVAMDFAAAGALFAMSGGRAFRHIGPGELALAFAALPFLIASTNMPFVLYAMDALRIANLAQVTGGLTLLVAAVVFVRVLDWGVAGALAAYLVSMASNAAVGSVWLLRRAGRPRIEWALARQLVSGGSQLQLNTVGTYLFTQSSVLILNAFRSAAETGEYQLALQLFMAPLLVSNAMAAVSYNLVTTRGPDLAWAEQRGLIKQALVLVSAGALAAYALAPIVIPIVAGRAFLPAVSLFRVLLPALVGATFSSMMASQWIGRGLFRQVSLLTIATGIVSVGCDFALIPRYGTRGAVVSTLVTYSVSFAANCVMMRWVDRQVAAARSPVHG